MPDANSNGGGPIGSLLVTANGLSVRVRATTRTVERAYGTTIRLVVE